MVDVRWFKIKDGPSKPYLAIPNARFWVWWNSGWVKITVPISEQVTLHKSYDHDEGWSYEAQVFEHHGDHITRAFYNDGCDCDGRMSSERHSSVGIVEMMRQSRKANDGTMTPDWKEGHYEQRDYEAEKAGY